MIYDYNAKIVNHNKVDDFFNDHSFVGYILPDGTIFKCKDHNVSNANTFLKMYLEILDKDYEKKDELLNTETNNKLSELILHHLKRMSHDKIHALLELINNSSFSISDLLVCYFGCHLVTRLKKEILTSEPNHECFYNYLLNDFKITNVGMLVYDEETKRFKGVHPVLRNDYLYDEINQIKNDAKENEIELFYKK